MSTVLVTGATGTTGVPHHLRTRRAAGRHRPLEGVDAAYFVPPSSARTEAQQLGFVELAAEAGVRHLVVLPQLGSREDSPVRFLCYHAAVERRVVELGLRHTFLRPNFFFQGLYAMAGLIAATGRFVAPIGYAQVSGPWAAEVTTRIEEVTGHPARDVRQFAPDYVDHFRPAVPARSA